MSPLFVLSMPKFIAFSQTFFQPTWQILQPEVDGAGKSILPEANLSSLMMGHAGNHRVLFILRSTSAKSEYFSDKTGESSGVYAYGEDESEKLLTRHFRDGKEISPSQNSCVLCNCSQLTCNTICATQNDEFCAMFNS